MENHHQYPDRSVNKSIETVKLNDCSDELVLLKLQNEELKQKLSCRHPQSLFGDCISDSKDQMIKELKEELARVKEERDELKQSLCAFKSNVSKYEPVANPLQTALVNYLISVEVLKSKEIEDVLRSIDRGDFAPKDAYIDTPQLIGFNTTISAPHMHVLQLELLKDCFKKAQRALDIGTGSGYMALALAKMMKKNNIKVYGIDHIPKLVDQARENISKHHSDYLKDIIEFHLGDGREGFSEFSPYDIIIVGGAVKEVPDVLIDQLNLGGSMLIPVGDSIQKLIVIHKTLEGKILKTAVMSVGFGKLQSVEEQCPDIDE